LAPEVGHGAARQIILVVNGFHLLENLKLDQATKGWPEVVSGTVKG
jgi:hypothetical protein